MGGFKDHFSAQAAAYSRYRPGYPPELIACVANSAPGRGLADGSGAGPPPSAETDGAERRAQHAERRGQRHRGHG